MGFLNPALLLLSAAVAVPVVLHLLHRHQGPRVVFPALRYLRRAEKENARRIRLRQLLLLALRAGALLLLALAAARPVLRFGGVGHEPSAVAIILDNSLSSGLVLGERRVLDHLKDRALETLGQATSEDRFWIIRAGAPWEPAVPVDAVEAAALVRETEVAANGSDLGEALARARSLLAAGAEGRAAEIHLLTDLQATAFRSTVDVGDPSPPVLVWAPREAPPPNTAITAVEVGGGFPPRAGERATVSAWIEGGAEGDSVPVRLALDNRISAAAMASPGAAAVLPFPARSEGHVSGWVELDPDALRGDDRRYFVARIQPPPTVALAEPVPFVTEALEVLADAGRLRPDEPGSAEVVLAPGGVGASAIRSGRTAVVLAPESPLELPALNRRLVQAGIPWRFAAAGSSGEARLVAEDPGDELVGALAEARIFQSYRLERAGAAGRDTVLLRLRDGHPWLVRGELPDGGRYLLVASPFSPEASSIPISAGLVPLVDRLVGAWAADEPDRTGYSPGERIALPAEATVVERPNGDRDDVAGGDYLVPAIPGIYRVFAGDRVVDAFAVNPPPEESDLARLDPKRLAAILPGWGIELVRGPDAWPDAVFHARLGREAWRPLVLLALAVLLIEGLIASAGGIGAGRAAGAASAGGSGLPPRKFRFRARGPRHAQRRAAPGTGTAGPAPMPAGGSAKRRERRNS